MYTYHRKRKATRDSLLGETTYRKGHIGKIIIADPWGFFG